MMSALIAVGIIFVNVYGGGKISQMEMHRIIILLLLHLPLIMIIINDFIVSCRTIIMNEKGCTIRILKYERFYRWEDFAVKRKEGKDWFTMGARYVNMYVPEKGVFFSIRPMKKPKSLDPQIYCMIHPFACFCIYLIDDIKVHNRVKDPNLFCEIDEKEFMQNMEKWGVELEEEG